MLSLNTHRSERPLSPVEVAEALDASLSRGASFQDLAASLSFGSTSTLKEIHRLQRLNERLRHLVGWGGRNSSSPLSMTAASQIARLPEEEHEEIVDAVLIEGFTAEEIRQVVETHIHSGRSIEECVDTVLRLRPAVERRELLVGAVISSELQSRLQEMTQRQRDELLVSAMSRCLDEARQWKGSLSATSFALLGDQEFGRRLRSMSGGFEAAINSCLQESLHVG